MGANAVEVTVKPPVHTATGTVIGGAGPADFGPGGTMEVFSQHYVRVRKPTQPLWFYVSEKSAQKR